MVQHGELNDVVEHGAIRERQLYQRFMPFLGPIRVENYQVRRIQPDRQASARHVQETAGRVQDLRVRQAIDRLLGGGVPHVEGQPDREHRQRGHRRHAVPIGQVRIEPERGLLVGRRFYHRQRTTVVRHRLLLTASPDRDQSNTGSRENQSRLAPGASGQLGLQARE